MAETPILVERLKPTIAMPTPPLVPEGPREIRELTHRFNAMTAELDRIRAEERDLLANVRHDLRTPLTVVTGFAEAHSVAGRHLVRADDECAGESRRYRACFQHREPQRGRRRGLAGLD